VFPSNKRDENVAGLYQLIVIYRGFSKGFLAAGGKSCGGFWAILPLEFFYRLRDNLWVVK